MQRQDFIKVAVAGCTGAILPSLLKGWVGLPSQAQESSTSELINSLRQGGQVIYFRHAAAVQGARPNAVAELPAQFRTCLEPQRALSQASVTAMQRLGASFRASRIPVGRVLASPACRAIETTWYAFNRAEVEPSLDGAKRERIWIELHQMLATRPAQGTNTILAAHVSNLQALTGLVIAEGEAVVFKPDGEGNFTLIARKKPEEWAALAS